MFQINVYLSIYFKRLINYIDATGLMSLKKDRRKTGFDLFYFNFRIMISLYIRSSCRLPAQPFLSPYPKTGNPLLPRWDLSNRRAAHDCQPPPRRASRLCRSHSRCHNTLPHLLLVSFFWQYAVPL